MRKHPVLLTLVFVLLTTLTIGIIAYPFLGEFINKLYANESVEQHMNVASTISAERKTELLNEAYSYNDYVANNVAFDKGSVLDAYQNYDNILNIGPDTQICALYIPKIECKQAVYHGTYEGVLNNGVMHLHGTSFPVEGNNVHAVLSAHTAYPNKEFFNNITELAEGDMFYIYLLGDTYSYKVVNVNIIEPDDSSSLYVVKGKNYCSLMTCYPFSVNTHRFVVTGELVKKESNISGFGQVQSESQPKSQVVNKNLYILIGLCVLWFIVVCVVIVRMVLFSKRQKRCQ